MSMNNNNNIFRFKTANDKLKQHRRQHDTHIQQSMTFFGCFQKKTILFIYFNFFFSNEIESEKKHEKGKNEKKTGVNKTLKHIK